MACRLTAAGLFALLAACTAFRGPPHPADIELAGVPFFPQEEYHCGPAALATLLGASGVPIAPEALAPQVYVPSRHGSLQVELVAAARRQQRLAIVIEPAATALQAALEAGHPVLVLQNFGSRARPLWHYAVVFGRERGDYLLRSGVTERQRLPPRRFLATWERAGRWGMALVEPGAGPPPFLQPRAWMEAVAAYEAAGHDARDSWRATVRRWPAEPFGLLGLATAEFTGGRLREAEDLYGRVLALDAGQVVAANNLALLLARRGCRAQARELLGRALAASGAERWREALDDTQREVDSLPEAAASGRCVAP